MKLKDLSYWLRGGIIALILSIIIRFILESGDNYFIQSLFYFPANFIHLNYDIVILMDLVAYIFWVIIGIIIGLIIDKLKSKSKNAN